MFIRVKITFHRFGTPQNKRVTSRRNKRWHRQTHSSLCRPHFTASCIYSFSALICANRIHSLISHLHRRGPDLGAYSRCERDTRREKGETKQEERQRETKSEGKGEQSQQFSAQDETGRRTRLRAEVLKSIMAPTGNRLSHSRNRTSSRCIDFPWTLLRASRGSPRVILVSPSGVVHGLFPKGAPRRPRGRPSKSSGAYKTRSQGITLYICMYICMYIGTYGCTRTAAKTASYFYV